MRQVVKPVDGEQADQVSGERPSWPSYCPWYLARNERRDEPENSHQQVDAPEYQGEPLSPRHPFAPLSRKWPVPANQRPAEDRNKYLHRVPFLLVLPSGLQ